MDFSGYIARRYLRSRRHSRFLSRGSATAVVGITIGVAVLNITLSIMNGFHAEMRRTFVENMPMITVVTSEPEGFTHLGETMDAVAGLPEVTGVAPFIRNIGIISAGRSVGTPRHQPGVIWGISPALVNEVQPLDRYLYPDPVILAGLSAGDVPRVILGADLANNLFAAIGDTIIITAAKSEQDLDAIEAESRRFVVNGYFETGMYEFDSRFVYISLDAARDFFDYPPQGAGLLGVKVADLMLANRTAEDIEQLLGRDFYATDWMELNRNLFQWIQLEKVIMALLLGMIILIAGFNIVGILTMMVGERRREIGILLAMGAERRQVMGIFLINGVWLGAVGIFFGTVVGLVGIFLLDRFGVTLPGDVYFVEKVPVLLQWTDLLLIALGTQTMALVAGLWPSWEASNLRPMDIIRYT